MEALNLSLLFAICVPVAAVAALNVWLALKGERGTLLLPSLGGFESKSYSTLVLSAAAAAKARARAEEKANRIDAANDEYVHEAA
jgi:hypothetical protein